MSKTKSFFYIGKYLPYVGDKKMFGAISFTYSLIHNKNVSICSALRISAKYYERDQSELGRWYAMLVNNIELEKDNVKLEKVNKLEKNKTKSSNSESWEFKMTQLEAIMLT